MLAVVAMTCVFVAYASSVGDPALVRGTFPVGDGRAHRYGALTFAEVTALVEQLRAERAAEPDPQRRAILSVRLSDVFVARQMFAEARDAIEEARRLEPDDPAVLVRAALVHHRLGDARGAEAALQEAERRSPGDADVARARAFIAGQEAEGPPE